MKNFKKLQYPLSLILILIGNNAYTIRDHLPEFLFSQTLQNNDGVLIQIPTITIMINHEGTTIPVTPPNEPAPVPIISEQQIPIPTTTNTTTWNIFEEIINYQDNNDNGHSENIPITSYPDRLDSNLYSALDASVEQPSLSDIQRTGKSLGKNVYRVDNKVFRIYNSNDGLVIHTPDNLAKIWNRFTVSMFETRNLSTAYGYSKDGSNFLVMPFIQGKNLIKKKSLIERIRYLFNRKLRDVPQNIRSEVVQMNDGLTMSSLDITGNLFSINNAYIRGKVKRYNGKLLPMDMCQINF